ncbi:MAG: cyclic nucleotide-binding domain-containing protein [Chloroflexaceae bacterium]|nr:cyclic nucleotide-binding domain-containing protein [Chloroflexaceae bacterium]
METDQRYALPIFKDLPADEFRWVCQQSSEVELQSGDFFLRENGPAEQFYIVLEGELQIIRTVNGLEQAMGTTPPGIIGGEIALLLNTPSQVSACAIVPSRLMVLDKARFQQVFTFAPTLGGRILEIATRRAQGLATVLVHQEKMAALGKLSAGLAHELNNPAAAAQRATASLRDTLTTLQTLAFKLQTLDLNQDQIDTILTWKRQAFERFATSPALSPLQRSDREDELTDWLDDQQVPNATDMASCFVSAAVTVDELDTLSRAFSASQLAGALSWLHGTLETMGLLSEVEQSTHRISELIGAIKSYTYRDQGVSQQVDIHRDLENTLMVFNHKLRKTQITIVRQFDPGVPQIHARGGELNQVWTNLIDNAIDALAGSGTIWLVTRHENRFVMVEVADDGPGIPPEVQPRLFEPFFTTKEVGSGTGLGLDISYRIIQEHNGSIEVQSEPGHTRFIVRLPVDREAR